MMISILKDEIDNMRLEVQAALEHLELLKQLIRQADKSVPISELSRPVKLLAKSLKRLESL